jgi:hypothetical protein
MEQFPHLLDCAQLFFLRTSKDPSKVQLWEMLLTVFGEILGFKLVHKSIRHDWIFFLVGLGFELRASYLQSRRSSA